MSVLSSKAKRQIEELIFDHHQALLVDVLGPQAVEPAVLAKLVAKGLVRQSVTRRDSVLGAFVLGKLAAHSGEGSTESLTAKQFHAYAEHAPLDVPMAEMRAVDDGKSAIGRHIASAAAGMITELNHAATDADAHQRRDEMINAARKELSRQHGMSNIIRRLKRKFKGAQVDWKMILATTLHNMIEEGKAHAFIRSAAGKDPRVFKRPRPDACAHCKALYLDGKRPRIFRLSQLSANGMSNQGRLARAPRLKGNNATEWLPTLGAAHPFCQCTLYLLPDGFAFDLSGNMVHVGMNKSEASVDILTPELRALLDHTCDV